jgi:hypothetical protein
VESAYLDTILNFYTDAGFPLLMVLDVELAGQIPNVPGEVLSLPPVQDMTVGRSDLQTVIRSCLREIFWCRLESEDKAFMIHFGYDFYVYISGVEPSPTTRAIAQSRGVFIEPCQSPYLGSE